MLMEADDSAAEIAEIGVLELKREISQQIERLLRRLDWQDEVLEHLRSEMGSFHGMKSKSLHSHHPSIHSIQSLKPDGKVSKSPAPSVAFSEPEIMNVQVSDKEENKQETAPSTTPENSEGPKENVEILTPMKTPASASAPPPPLLSDIVDGAKDKLLKTRQSASNIFSATATSRTTHSFSSMEIKDAPPPTPPAQDEQTPDPRGLTTYRASTSDNVRWKLTKSSPFEIFFGALIVLNAVWIGIETDFQSKTQGTDGALILGVVTQLFSFAFFIELVARLIVERMDFFLTRNDILWNAFDFFLVAGSILEFVIFLMSNTSDQDTADGPGSLQNLRLIRMIRLVRLMRLLRMARIVRFVRALRVLVHSIGTTLKSLLWALVLLAAIMYFFAVMFTEAVNGYLVETSGCIESVCAIDEGPWSLFGTVPRAMFTLYKAISNGMDWGACTLILGDVGAVWVAFFVLYIAFTYFAVLNVVTGVFCQKAIESAARDRELAISTLMENRQAHVDNIKHQFNKIFGQLDSDSSGTISLEEFQAHMDDDKVSGFFILLDIDASDAFALFKLLDDDGSGAIDAEEFIDGCLRLQGTARSIDLAKVRHECKNMLKKIHNSSLSQDKHNKKVMLHQVRQLDDLAKKVDEMLARSMHGIIPLHTVDPSQDAASSNRVKVVV